MANIKVLNAAAERGGSLQADYTSLLIEYEEQQKSLS